MISEHIPVLMIAVPLLIAFALPLIHRVSRLARDVLAVLAVAFNAVLCFALMLKIYVGGAVSYTLGGTETALAMPSGNVLPIRILLNSLPFVTVSHSDNARSSSGSNLYFAPSA